MLQVRRRGCSKSYSSSLPPIVLSAPEQWPSGPLTHVALGRIYWMWWMNDCWHSRDWVLSSDKPPNLADAGSICSITLLCQHTSAWVAIRAGRAAAWQWAASCA